MGFFNKYPYLDMHELNLDWLLGKMQELDKRLDDAVNTISNQVYVRVMTDIDPTIQGIRNDLVDLSNRVDRLRNQYNELDVLFTNFENYVEERLTELHNYADYVGIACNEYTNTRINQNNEYILSTLTEYLAQVKVINFFTGELVSVQSMFDYLAQLHATDSIDYNTMASRSKTYTQLAAFNKTYTDLVTSGNSWYV